jgi:hypothetical protein
VEAAAHRLGVAKRAAIAARQRLQAIQASSAVLLSAYRARRRAVQVSSGTDRSA